MSEWTQEELQIFEGFDNRCVLCWINLAVTLHEIIPKSKDKDWMRPENRVPVCAKCHDQIHRFGALNFAELLLGRLELRNGKNYH